MSDETEIDYLKAILARLEDKPVFEQRRHDELMAKLESIEAYLAMILGASDDR
jgi:hypothetical protein